MAVDVFLVFPAPLPSSVSAEPVTDQYFATTFKGAAVVPVRSFSLGEENLITIGSTSTGAGAGKAVLKELVVEKAVDKLSRWLFSMSATGVHFPRAQIYVRRSGATTAKPYLAYGFEMVFVKAIDWSGASGDDGPYEQVTFAYGALALGYYAQKPDGTLDAPVKTSWSQVLNKEAPTDTILAGF